MQAQLGNTLGVTAVNPDNSFICDVIADGANTVTVAAVNAGLFTIGQVIVFRVKATQAVFGATARTITNLGPSGFDLLITYNGADAAVVPGTHGIYDGDVPLAQVNGERTNLNGGSDEQSPYFNVNIGNVDSMRRALGLLVPAANLDAMTYNDLVYACRVYLQPNTIK